MKKIGKYEIIEKLGDGGMGEVYKAHDPLLQRDVAIKVISEKAFDHPEIKERFFREARAAAQLLHENITVVYDLGEEDGQPYIVMEYLTGTDLRSIIKSIQTGQREPLSLFQKLDYARQICRGFEFLHAKDIIHRDLKPENIRILDNGKAKIMDFGIAKSLSMASTMTQAGMIMGTPGYMSPEQIKGQKVDKRSDIFSFGVLFYEVVTSKLPFKGQEVTSIWYNIVHEPPEEIDDLEIENLSPVRDIILKTLKKAPNERYQSFSDLLNDLEALIKLKEAELKRLAEERRKRVEKLLAESDNFLKKKNFARALEKAEEAGKIATDQRSARELIALIKEDEEKENRRRLFEEKIRAAQKLIREKQYQQAVEFLNETLRIWPDHAEALKLRQEAQDGIRLEEERQRLEQMLAQGREYLQQNDFANAERLAVEGLKLNPQSHAALHLLESVKIKKEEEEKKHQRLQERLQNAWQALQEQQYERAIAAAELVLQDAPDQADAVKLIEDAKTGISRREEQKRIDNLLATGKDCLERHDLERAQKKVEEILQLRPQEPKALKLAGAIAKRKEDEEKKKRLAAEKLATARNLAAEEKYHKAIGVLKEVLLLAPDDAEAKSLLQHLIDETNAQIAAVEETKFIKAPSPETKRRRAEVDETILIEPEPAAKRPSRATGRRPAETAPFKFKRMHLIAAAVVVLGIAGVGGWYLLSDSKSRTPNSTPGDLSGPATAAKEALTPLKTEAGQVGVGTWAAETHRHAVESEQKGDRELAAGNYAEARQTYEAAADSFRAAIAGARRSVMTVMTKDLNQLKARVASTKREVQKAKQAAESVNAATLAAAAFAEAARREREGDQNEKSNSDVSLAAAQQAYVEAANGYTKAKHQVDALIQARVEAENAKTEMERAKSQLPGRVQDWQKSANFADAEKAAASGKRLFEAADYAAAGNSFQQAKGLYREAQRELEKSAWQSQAEAAQAVMQQARAQVPQENNNDTQYREAERLKAEGENLYGNGAFETAATQFKAAQALYNTVAVKAKEKRTQQADIVADAQRDVQGLSNRLKTSLENRDLKGLKVVYGKAFTSEDESSWASFFKIAKDITATVTGNNLQVTPNNVRVDIMMKITYTNNKNERIPADVLENWTLESNTGQWTISMHRR